MSKGALRYPSPEAMPDGMRRLFDRQGAAKPPAPKARAPRQRRDEEHNHQVVFFNRVRALADNDERFALAARRTFAIPNGGHRGKKQAGRLKAEGVRPGVFDICVSLPAGDCHGMWIEMKSLEGYPSDEQKKFGSESQRLGYEAIVCRGADAAFEAWKTYVEKTFL